MQPKEKTENENERQGAARPGAAGHDGAERQPAGHGEGVGDEPPERVPLARPDGDALEDGEGQAQGVARGQV